MNRKHIITDGLNEVTVFAECKHCGEPWTIEGIPPSSLSEKDNTKTLCYCRGSNGLSFKTRCCILLKCDVKNKHYCDALPVAKGKSFPVKHWNVIVSEPEIIEE